MLFKRLQRRQDEKDKWALWSEDQMRPWEKCLAV
jgi:hypothetical protein